MKRIRRLDLVLVVPSCFLLDEYGPVPLPFIVTLLDSMKVCSRVWQDHAERTAFVHVTGDYDSWDGSAPIVIEHNPSH